MAFRKPEDERLRADSDAGRPMEGSERIVPYLRPLGPVQTAEEEVAALLVEVDALNGQVERLRLRAAASEREAILLSEHLTTKGTLAGELRSEVRHLRGQLEAVAGERAALAEQLATTRAQLEARSADLEVAHRDLRMARGELTQERRTAEAEGARAELATAEIDELRARLQMAEAETEALRARVQRADEHVATLDGQLQTTEALVADLAAEVPSGAAPGAEPQAPHEQLSAELEAARAETVRARAEAAAAAERLRTGNEEWLATTELLVAAEEARDAYAGHLKAVSTSAFGRLAYRWATFAEQHPRGARVLRAPLAGAWMLLTLRWPAWLRQHPLFDRDWYLETNRDVAGSRLRPWWHYVRHGVPEGRMPNRYFDRDWYLRNYPDVRMAGMDPLDHYYRRGCWEGRDPGPKFQTDWYLARHPEVAAAGLNPLLHFMRVGVHAGDLPAPSRDPAGPGARPSSPSDRSLAARPGAAPAPTPAPAPLARTSPVRADVRRIRKLVTSLLPAGARVGVISDGNDELLDLEGVVTTPVPRGLDGRRASDVPRNDLSAIAHLEWLRVTHIDDLLAPDPSLWLTVVPGLVEHLDRRFGRRSPPGAAAMLWDLRTPDLAGGSEVGDLPAALDRLRERMGRAPTVLDWGSGLEPGRLGSDVMRFEPLDPSRVQQPYADASIDVVLVREGDALRRDEARRMATSLVVVASTDRGKAADLEWLAHPGSHERASVSIVIPTYNDTALLAACLRTLDETLSADVDAEVIVADDGSEAAWAAELEALVGRHARARLVRNETNGGYIAAVSAGAAEARHEVLVFLNNDTVLLPGWLDPLLETLRRRPEVGVVGGMLLYPDGRLQEAGCAIFRDGSATKIGYGDDDPTLPWYGHPRSVDYVSGALMATPRSLFESLGGLDRAFGFGYYEDGDYCFRVRKAGHDVVYEPRSRVVHVEGGTAGLDLTRGVKRFQARNQALFVERWARELERLPARPRPLDLSASRDLVVRGSSWPTVGQGSTTGTG